MVTVKCDMCGKDISNHDDRRTSVSFPKEDKFVCYDICRECANKIEEFIKASHKYHCEPISPEEQEALDKWKEGLSETAMFKKPESDPCEGCICFEAFNREDDTRCTNLIHSLDSITMQHVFHCNEKNATLCFTVDEYINKNQTIMPGDFEED